MTSVCYARAVRRGVLLAAVAVAGTCAEAGAYIDPGTGGSFGSLLGYLVSLVVAVGVLAWGWLRVTVGHGRRVVGVPLWKVAAVAACLGAIAWVVWMRRGEGEKDGVVSTYRESSVKRVLVLGMDGLDPQLLAGWMTEGILPNFARLQASGGLSLFQTSNPPQSPVAWSCLATGANPGLFGLFDFIHRDPKTYTPYLSLMKEKTGGLSLGGPRYVLPRSGTPFWDVVTAAGLPAVVIRWPVTFPARLEGGKLLAGLGVPDVLGGLGRYTLFCTSPPEPEDEARHKVTVVSRQGQLIDTHLRGPRVSGLGGDREVTAPLQVEIAGPRAVEVRLGDERARIRVGEWSDWMRVKYALDPIRRVKGMCRFYLQRVEPDLELYATAVVVDPRDPEFRISDPQDYARQLADEIGDYHTLGLAEDTKALTDGHLTPQGFLEQCDWVLDERRAMLRLELARFREGLLALVIDQPDRVQHMFWREMDPSHPRHDPQSPYRHAIRDMYLRLDGILGEVLGSIDSDTVLLVCSDHGFTSFGRSVDVNRWLIEAGYMTLAHESMAGGEETTLFRNVDWGRTRAYALGFGSIYLNRAGREGEGIVEEGEVQRLKQEIGQRLAALEDGGREVVRHVYDAERVYRGPHVGEGPDLVVGLQRGYRVSWETAIGGYRGQVLSHNERQWSGDHCVDPELVPGVLFSNRPLSDGMLRQTDLGPTVLKCLGLGKPMEMEGISVLAE